jgi:alkylhydroperoxidase/carboxymuconolactone decarboxylase family protein YurZ
MEESNMTRNEIEREIESMLGFIPSWFQPMTDQTLELEWMAWKAQATRKGAIPEKYRELISAGIMAATQDKYGVFYCTEAAKMAGATEEEIQEVAEIVKYDVGWGPFLRLNQVDFEQFKNEVVRAMDTVKTREMTKTSM